MACRTMWMASDAFLASPDCSKSMAATVPARPSPPLQWTTTFCPLRMSATNSVLSCSQSWRSLSSGAAPSVIGNPYHEMPFAAATSGKLSIRRSLNSQGSSREIRCLAPQWRIAKMSASRSLAHAPVMDTSWYLPGANVTPMPPPQAPTGSPAISSGWLKLVRIISALPTCLNALPCALERCSPLAPQQGYRNCRYRRTRWS